ncbi:MAG: hydroxymethylbilane synthase [Chloroflexota bacterium]|nr:hydroxymethylbilane synthase [Chloroflexota bacterium]
MTPRQRNPSPPIKIGTRGSALALAQVTAVERRLAVCHPSVRTETVIVATQGDIDKVSPLTDIGGRGVFTNALERELAHGHIDAAVHSAKDLPSQISSELPIVAFPEREDPRDVLVSRHGVGLAELPPRPVIGTSSRRREAQIRWLRPDAQIVSLRGNIDTRLRKAMQPEYDAIVLAAAGLSRMGWRSSITEYFAIDALVPAPGQGALAIQTSSQSECRDTIASLDDAAVAEAVQAERAFLAAIGAGCTMPVGAHVERGEHGLRLVAFVENDEGSRVAQRHVLLGSSDATEQAAAVAQEMQAEVSGVRRTLWPGSPVPRHDLAGVNVAVTRPRRQSRQLIESLSERGATPLALPTIRIEPPTDRAPLDAALRALAAGAFTWVIFTSANAVEAVASAATDLGARDECVRAIRAAAVGDATARAARDLGLDVAVVAEEPTADGLVAALLPRLQAGESVLYPRSALGRELVPTALCEAGVDVTVVDAYCTLPETEIEAGVMARLRAGSIDVIVFSSPSSVTALQAMLGQERNLIERIPAVCAGPVTAAAVREAGLAVAMVSTHPGAPHVVEAVVDYWNSREPAQLSLTHIDDRTRLSERITGR